MDISTTSSNVHAFIHTTLKNCVFHYLTSTRTARCMAHTPSSLTHPYPLPRSRAPARTRDPTLIRLSHIVAHSHAHAHSRTLLHTRTSTLSITLDPACALTFSEAQSTHSRAPHTGPRGLTCARASSVFKRAPSVDPRCAHCRRHSHTRLARQAQLWLTSR
jgi:hypothetical protein